MDTPKLKIVACECGCLVTKCNLTKHIQSQKHQSRVKLIDHPKTDNDKREQVGSTFHLRWKNNLARKTKYGDRYFQKNLKYKLVSLLRRHREIFEAYVVGNEFEMLNTTAVFQRPVGEPSLRSFTNCVLKTNEQMTAEKLRDILESRNVRSPEAVNVSVSVAQNISAATRDDVRAVVQNFDNSMASTRWKAHQYAAEVGFSTKISWSDVVPSKIPVSERKIFEDYFSKEQAVAQLERQKELARTTKLRWWQMEARNMITELDNERAVWWIYDTTGNTGKTFLGEWFAKQDGIKLENSRSQDIAMLLNDQKFVVFDFARQTVGRINYAIIENIKNGRVFSSKYHSRVKVLHNNPTVICFANRMPNTGPNSLSRDRWRIFEIVADKEHDYRLLAKEP